MFYGSFYTSFYLEFYSIIWGTRQSGRFACTITLTDVWSGWTVNAACLGKDRQALKEAFHKARKRMYHKVSEYHPDNNQALLKNLLELSHNMNIFEVSRSRPYKKNDNAHVEQKNKERVRRWVGYRRYDTQEQVDLLNRLYELLDPFQNFYIPSTKLIQIQRNDNGKIIRKKYDIAKTPYERLIKSEEINPRTKEKLSTKRNNLSLTTLKQHIDHILALLSNT